MRTFPKDIAARRQPGAPAPGGDGLTTMERMAATQKMLLPPGFYPPYGSQNWMLAGNQSMPGAGVTTKFSGVGASFQVPDGFSGYVTELQVVVNNLLVTSDITFRLLFDDGAVSGFDKMLMPQAGMAVYVWGPDKTYIPVPDGTKIEVSVSIVDAGPYLLSILARGWFYQGQINERWKGLAG